MPPARVRPPQAQRSVATKSDLLRKATIENSVRIIIYRHHNFNQEHDSSGETSMKSATIVAILFLSGGHFGIAKADGFVPLFSGDGVPGGWLVREWSDVAKEVPGIHWTVKDGTLYSGIQRGTWLISE